MRPMYLISSGLKSVLVRILLHPEPKHVPAIIAILTRLGGVNISSQALILGKLIIC